MPTHFVPLSELPFLGTSQHIRRERHEGLLSQQKQREVVLGCLADGGNALAKVRCYSFTKCYRFREIFYCR